MAVTFPPACVDPQGNPAPCPPNIKAVRIFPSESVAAGDAARQAKIAAAAAGDVLPRAVGVTHTAPHSVSVTMDTRTGTHKP